LGSLFRGFSRVNLCHDCCPHAVGRSANWVRRVKRRARRQGARCGFAGRSAWQSVWTRNWVSRSPSAGTIEFHHSGHAGRPQKEAHIRAIKRRKSLTPFFVRLNARRCPRVDGRCQCARCGVNKSCGLTSFGRVGFLLQIDLPLPKTGIKSSNNKSP